MFFLKKKFVIISLLMGIACTSWAEGSSFILDDVSIDGLEGLQSDVVKSRLGFK
ncbi:MAG: outer membrane protein insertion porin family, partial [Francisella sp.]